MNKNFKATKTVLALAIAGLMVGGAFAAEAETPAKSVWQDGTTTSVTVGAGQTVAVDVTSKQETGEKEGQKYNTNVATVIVDGGTLNVLDGNRILNNGKANSVFQVNSGVVTIAGRTADDKTGTDNNKVASVDTQNVLIKGGDITLGKKGEVGSYMLGWNSFVMTGGTLTMNEGSQIRVNNEKADGMQLEGGNIVLNGTERHVAQIFLNGQSANTEAAVHLDGVNVTVAEKAYGEISSPKTDMTKGGIAVEKGAQLVVTAEGMEESVAGNFSMTGGKVAVAAEGLAQFDTTVNADNGEWTTTDGQIRFNESASITDGVINLKATEANLKVNDGVGYFDGVGLVAGDQGSAQNLTLGKAGTNLVANVQDGAHIDSFGTMTIAGGTFNVGGELYGSKNNDSGMGQAWRQGSQIYSEGAMTITGGTFNLGKNAMLGSGTSINVSNATINLNGTRDAVAMIGAWGTDTIGSGALINVEGTGVIKLSQTEGSPEEATTFKLDGGDLTVGSNGTLVVTAWQDQFYDEAAEGQTSKGLITIPAEMKGLVILDGKLSVGDVGENKSSDVVAPSVTVGTASGVTNKNTKMEDAVLEIGQNGYLEANTLTLGVDGTVTNNGEMYVSGKMVADIDVQKGETAAFTNNGDLWADLSNFGSYKIENNALTFEKSTLGEKFTQGQNAHFYDFGVTDTLTLTNFNSLESALGQTGTLVLLNAQVTADDGKALTFADAAEQEGGFTSPSTVVAAEAGADGSVALTTQEQKPVVVADVSTDAKKVVISGNGGLTLAGTGATAFGSAVENVEVTGAGLTLGYENAIDYKGGTINAAVKIGDTNVSAINVAAGDWRITKNVELVANSFLEATDREASLTVNGAVKGAGFVLVTNGGQISLSSVESTVALIGAEGTISVSDKYVADPDAQLPQDTSFYGAINVGTFDWTERNRALPSGAAVVGFGTSSTEEANAIVEAVYGKEAEDQNIIVLKKQISFANGVTFGSEANLTNAMIVDMSAVADTAYFEAEDGAINGAIHGTAGEIALTNITNKALFDKEIVTEAGVEHVKHFKVSSAYDGNGTIKVDYGTLFYGDATTTNELAIRSETDPEKLTALKNYGQVEADGTISFAPNKMVMDYVKALDLNTYGDLEQAVVNVQGGNEITNALIYGLDNMAVAAYNEAVDLGIEQADREAYVHSKIQGLADELNIATNMAVASGAFSTAVDINNEVWKALDRRMTLANLNAPRAAYGVTPWVDVIGTTNEAKDIFGGAGYEADLYGAVLGADWTAPCGAIVGLAFSVGQADGNSVDLGTKVDNDADFYGISLYGSHQIGSFNGKIDIGYVSVSNDLSTHTMLGKFDESLDADIFTMGLGAEYLVKAGSLNVVPHAGIRWSRIDMDDSKYGADYDAMNLFQMPMGVTFSGTFDMTGWKVAPMLDLSVVPAFGDKDAVATYTGGIKDTTRVVDTNPIQMTLGVNAQVDAWTFGVNYGLTAGGDERLNNSFNLNARYTF